MMVMSSMSRPLLLGFLGAWHMLCSSALRPKSYDFDLDFKPDGFGALDKQEPPRQESEIEEMALLEEEAGTGGWRECQAALTDFAEKFLKIPPAAPTEVPTNLADRELMEWWIDTQSVKLALTGVEALSTADKGAVALVRKALERLVRLNAYHGGKFAGLAAQSKGKAAKKMAAAKGDSRIFAKAWQIPLQQVVTDDGTDPDFEFGYEEGYMVAVYILSKNADLVNGYMEEYLRQKLQSITDLELGTEEHDRREGLVNSQYARLHAAFTYLSQESQIGKQAGEFFKAVFEQCVVAGLVKRPKMQSMFDRRLALESKTNEVMIKYFGDVNLRKLPQHVLEHFEWEHMEDARTARLEALVEQFADPEVLP